jgi:hypothetical protein
MRLIYIAGPYRGDVVGNIRRATGVAERVARAGDYPVTPHLLSPPHFESIQGDEFWLSATMELMRRCDEVLLMRGWDLSRGAIAEHAEANRLGMKVWREDEYLAQKMTCEVRSRLREPGVTKLHLPPPDVTYKMLSRQSERILRGEDDNDEDDG